MTGRFGEKVLLACELSIAHILVALAKVEVQRRQQSRHEFRVTRKRLVERSSIPFERGLGRLLYTRKIVGSDCGLDVSAVKVPGFPISGSGEI